MYVDLRILSSTYSIQLRDEAGAAIGSEITYSNTNYKLVRDTASQTYLILEATRNDTAFPPIAALPFGKTVIVYD